MPIQLSCTFGTGVSDNLYKEDFAWTFQDVTVNNCNIGFDFLLGVSHVSIIDAVIRNTPIAVRSAAADNTTLAGSLVLDNIRLHNVTTAVADASNATVLAGGASMTVKTWVQGNVYAGTDSTGTFTQGFVTAAERPLALLDSAGRIFGKTHPQYADYSVTQFVSTKDHGAKGDGKTDDTAALQALLYKSAGRKIVFFDAGTYVVTSTLTVPAGTRIVGEAWSVIAGMGEAFSDVNNPRVVVKVGEKGSCGVVEITDIVFTTVGPIFQVIWLTLDKAPGAIIIEWNVKEPAFHQGGAAAGTNLELANCPPGALDTAPCMAAFLAIHLTPGSSAYLEACFLQHYIDTLFKGTWVWLADHDMDGDGASQLSIYSGRGILSESEGPVWMIGTAEHHVLYQYRLVNAQNHYMGLMQTETPYWQPVPPVPEPFAIDPAFKDPDYSETDVSAWALSVEASNNILIFGAGLYSFFQNYTQTCLNTRNCQGQIIDIDADSSVSIYGLSTVASAFQISVEDVGVVNQSDNLNGFVSTVTVWTSEQSEGSSGGIGVQVGVNI
ncbi:hypothetical protein H0H92_013402 [Tricholoma furcatifolium]|nr:hypothetical protein H0H92_013402 [Tricholoma furcatifolium]